MIRSEVLAVSASEQAVLRAVPATDTPDCLVSTTGGPSSLVQTPTTMESLESIGHRHQADTYIGHTVTPPSANALVPDIATPQNQEGDSSASTSVHSRRAEDIEIPSVHEEEDIGIDVNDTRLPNNWNLRCELGKVSRDPTRNNRKGQDNSEDPSPS
ncbi:hypothetical protein L798_07342 [Zootermopsis nevadensis]|uniref:Uncharacterized protein n=1 Tax=Zootermopsis nevadensis TaxID=136037 RepID=A0A067QF14_ZOONE|nr:hypothetical protein L798_07342 [Zootermopsis nevadensis]